MDKEPIKSPIQPKDISESKVQESIENLSEKGGSNDASLFLSAFLKALKGEKGEKGEKGDTGENGKDYKLTDLDKKAIANTVYSLVQDRLDEDTDEVVSDALIVIDKKLPEKIRLALEEQKPLIKEVVSGYLNTLKEENIKNKQKLEDKIESVSKSLESKVEQSLDKFWSQKKKEVAKMYKPEVAEKIVERIKGKISWHDIAQRPNIISGLAHLVDVDTTGATSSTKVLKPKFSESGTLIGFEFGNQSGGGSSVETPVGVVDGSNTSFTVSNEPAWIIVDGITYFDGAGYTYGAGTLTIDTPPVSFIRSIY